MVMKSDERATDLCTDSSSTDVFKVYSFDVFETSLIRCVAVPSDVFRIIGRRVARGTANVSASELIEDFFSARIEAERLAREAAGAGECTLGSIWTILRSVLPGLLSTFGPEYELDGERSVIVANRQVAAQIAGLRARGARIIFASDTYLPEKFVRSELICHGLATEADACYVSSALNLTKESGSLFRYILQQEKIAAREMHHYGDNAWSDYSVPKRLGISSALYRDSALNKWERALIGRNALCQESGSFLAGSMRVSRLVPHDGDHADGARDLVATFLGPLVLIWASWVLGAARQDRVRRLYFAARDGYLVWRAARILASDFGEIDCRYLKISRKAVLVPAIIEISSRGIPWLRRSGKTPELQRLVQKLGLTWQEVAAAFSALAKAEGGRKLLITERDWSQFWEILQTPPVADVVRARIAHRRASAVAYLRAKGVTESAVPAAIVDVGPQARQQTAVQELLGGVRSSLRGYYLALETERAPLSASGRVRALFYQDAADRSRITGDHTIFRQIYAMEHVLGLAPHGTVQEYGVGDPIEAVCAPVSIEYRKYVGKVVGELEKFCAEHRRDAILYVNESAARELMDTLVRVWWSDPSKAAVESLGHVFVGDELNDTDSQLLVEPWQLHGAAKNLLPSRIRKFVGLSVQRPVWPEAALQRTGWAAARLLRLREILVTARNHLRS
jgi:FMN phosphatase YigB (HAD superfamily)